ncbi:SsrA-binding protein [Pontibacter ummariensis]|uniref:SsrA-binding protein n=1 Tax=Pontibacter ummariensis TaxID=1610492 RepID=A0A239FCQ7_9BACT|nr:SsrA-binding protein SmpB [Pontibacter ummariensis]PRY12330.1 SsrA-binding protein [Pontibacter ummariensis]SNS54278.1 SsrA-binding protein [Pontibacter ummariensis]
MAKDKDRIQKHVNIVNRKASFEYQFIDKYTAGMMLKGTEIKSIREGKVNIGEGYCVFQRGELWLYNVHIAPYTEGTHFNHEPLRPRKLLMNKRELRRLESDSQEQGITVIPTRIFISDRGFAKVEIALAKGKKLYDKRQDIKEKDVKREMDRAGY